MASSSKKKKCTKDSIQSLEMKLRVNDINQKLKIVTEIVKVLKYEELSNKLICDPTMVRKRVFNYTFEELSKTHKIKENLTLKIISQRQTKDSLIPYCDIRSIITNFYINMRCIPTINSIITELKKNKLYEALSKNELLDGVRNSGYQWKRVPNTDMCIIVENPEQVSKRFQYLQKIIKHRESENRNMVYIYERTFDDMSLAPDTYNCAEKSKFFVILCVSKYGPYLNFASFHRGDNLKDILLEYATSVLKEPSVLVIYEKLHHPKVPVLDEYSSKKEMCEWLTMNNIPHDPKSHRADMFKLIRSRRRYFEDTDILNERLKEYGHEVLTIPHGMSMLNYFYEFKDKINRSASLLLMRYAISILPTLRNILENLVNNEHTQTDWENFEKTLIQREKQIYKEDLRMDTIIDQLMTMAEDKQFTEEDLGDLGEMMCNLKDVMPEVTTIKKI